MQRVIPPDLQRKIRYLATIRNKLVHERDFHHIPVRAAARITGCAQSVPSAVLSPPAGLLRQ